MTSSMMSHGDLKFALYIQVYENMAPGARCKGNNSSINADVVMVFLG